MVSLCHPDTTSDDFDGLDDSGGTAEDAAEIADLVNRACKGEGGGWTNERDIVAGLRTSVGGVLEMMERGTFLVVREGGTGPIRGSVFLEPGDSDSLYVGMLSVDPAMQDRGLGRMLPGECEVSARRRSVSSLTMTVLEVRGDLRRWYERHRYEATGERIAFPHDAGLKLLAYRKEL